MTADPFTPLSFPAFLAGVKRDESLTAPRGDCLDCGQPVAWCECPECNQGDTPVSATREPLTKLEHVEGVGLARVRDDGSVLRRAYSPRERAEAVRLYRDELWQPKRIADHLGIPRETVKSWTRRLGALV